MMATLHVPASKVRVGDYLSDLNLYVLKSEPFDSDRWTLTFDFDHEFPDPFLHTGQPSIILHNDHRVRVLRDPPDDEVLDYDQPGTDEPLPMGRDIEDTYLPDPTTSKEDDDEQVPDNPPVSGG